MVRRQDSEGVNRGVRTVEELTITWRAELPRNSGRLAAPGKRVTDEYFRVMLGV
jgi:hypothetical protein